MANTPELARGELMRFFAEAAWYPTALLPNQGLQVARDQLTRYVLATPPGHHCQPASTRAGECDPRCNPAGLRAGRGVARRFGAWQKPAVLSAGAIRAPTLVISTRDDGFGTFASAQYAASRIAGAKFIGYDHGGHIWVGHDDEVRAEIVKLLANRGKP